MVHVKIIFDIPNNGAIKLERQLLIQSKVIAESLIDFPDAGQMEEDPLYLCMKSKQLELLVSCLKDEVLPDDPKQLIEVVKITDKMNIKLFMDRAIEKLPRILINQANLTKFVDSAEWFNDIHQDLPLQLESFLARQVMHRAGLDLPVRLAALFNGKIQTIKIKSFMQRHASRLFKILLNNHDLNQEIITPDGTKISALSDSLEILYNDKAITLYKDYVVTYQSTTSTCNPRYHSYALAVTPDGKKIFAKLVDATTPSIWDLDAFSTVTLSQALLLAAFNSLNCPMDIQKNQHLTAAFEQLPADVQKKINNKLKLFYFFKKYKLDFIGRLLYKF